jgi:DNA repair exonuclease SbcCD nuclease subunit
MEEEMKFTVMGDAHLWPALWQRMPDAREDTFCAARDVFKAATDGVMVSSGDLFNFGEKGGVSAVLRFLAQDADALPRVKKFLFVTGNHDRPGFTSGEANPAWLDGLADPFVGKLVHLMPDRFIEHEGVTFAGIDHQASRELVLDQLALVRKAGKPNVLVMHQGLCELLNIGGACEIGLEDLDGIADLVIIGHVHVCREFETGKGTKVLSPGSLVPWQMDEDMDKKFPVVELKPLVGVNVEWHDITTKRDIQVMKVMSQLERDEALPRIAQLKADDSRGSLRRPILRIEYMADPMFHGQLMRLVEQNGIIIDPVAHAPMTGELVLGAFEKVEDQSDEIQVASVKHTNPGMLRDAVIEIQKTKDPAGVLSKYLDKLAAGEELERDENV